jgi:hypothetical protein
MVPTPPDPPKLFPTSADNTLIVVFLIFLASFAVLEVILWRAEKTRQSQQTPAGEALPSILALAQSLNAEGRGALPGTAERTPADTLK